MGISTAWFTIEWCVQSHLSTDDYDDAQRGLQNVRFYRRLIQPIQAPFIALYDWKRSGDQKGPLRVLHWYSADRNGDFVGEPSGDLPSNALNEMDVLEGVDPGHLQHDVPEDPTSDGKPLAELKDHQLRYRAPSISVEGAVGPSMPLDDTESYQARLLMRGSSGFQHRSNQSVGSIAPLLGPASAASADSSGEPEDRSLRTRIQRPRLDSASPASDAAESDDIQLSPVRPRRYSRSGSRSSRGSFSKQDPDLEGQNRAS